MSWAFRNAVARFEIARVRQATRRVREFSARLAPALERLRRHRAWEAISKDTL